jgi:hypothetical protein
VVIAYELLEHLLLKLKTSSDEFSNEGSSRSVRHEFETCIKIIKILHIYATEEEPKILKYFEVARRLYKSMPSKTIWDEVQLKWLSVLYNQNISNFAAAEAICTQFIKMYNEVDQTPDIRYAVFFFKHLLFSMYTSDSSHKGMDKIIAFVDHEKQQTQNNYLKSFLLIDMIKLCFSRFKIDVLEPYLRELEAIQLDIKEIDKDLYYEIKFLSFLYLIYNGNIKRAWDLVPELKKLLESNGTQNEDKENVLENVNIFCRNNSGVFIHSASMVIFKPKKNLLVLFTLRMFKSLA